MEIEFLRHFGLKPELVQCLRDAHGDTLLPLQERVIRDEGLFESNNLVICAPTSSGKTFLAEILFLHQVMQGRGVLLLAPTKALAHQRYLEWKQRYEPLGYRIALSTRDHPHHDAKIRQGDFHLAVVIYEKLRALLAQGDGMLNSVGACLVDELHYLFEPQRGAALEMLLSRIRQQKGIQLLGLSAMINDPAIADWLGARLVVDTRRPVELRQGVLCADTFTYREFNTGVAGTETFGLEAFDDEGEAMLEAGRFFASRGEPTLLFWPTRNLCYSAAKKLAETYETDEEARFAGFDTLEETVLREQLGEWLPRRIAVHTSDLTPEERRVVEQAIADRSVVLICATGTLAEGLNFPVVNVLTTRHMVASKPGETNQTPVPMPIPADRLWNMIGRAGRLGMSEFGRGMILTTHAGDIDGLLSQYAQSKPVSRQSLLVHESWARLVLMSACGRSSFDLPGLLARLEATFCAHQSLWPQTWQDDVRREVGILVQQGFLLEDYGQYTPTPMGALVIRQGIRLETARRLRDSVNRVSVMEDGPLVWVLESCLTPEVGETYISISRNDLLTHLWPNELHKAAEEAGLASHDRIRAMIRDPASLAQKHHEAMKKTMLLHQWMEGESITALEQSFRVHSGMIQRLAEDVAWVIGAIAELAGAHALDPNHIRLMQRAQERVLVGLPDGGIRWAAAVRRSHISRSQALRLIHNRITSPDDITPDSLDYVSKIIPRSVAEALMGESPADVATERVSSDYIVQWNPAHPTELRVNGEPVSLTPLQCAFMAELSRSPKECVGYSALLDALWPSEIGERKQLSRQKNAILEKVKKALGHPVDDLILTTKGIGIALNAHVAGVVPQIDLTAE